MKFDWFLGGVVVFGYEKEWFFVICGNLVLEVDVDMFRFRLEEIVDMDEDILCKYYRIKLCEGLEFQSEGGFIGLFEIVWCVL